VPVSGKPDAPRGSAGFRRTDVINLKTARALGLISAHVLPYADHHMLVLRMSEPMLFGVGLLRSPNVRLMGQLRRWAITVGAQCLSALPPKADKGVTVP
jgi:hypothetical protein